MEPPQQQAPPQQAPAGHEQRPTETTKAGRQKALKYEPRADGGFGPMGSGSWDGASGGGPSYGRNPANWAIQDEDAEESREVELSTTSGRRPGEADAAMPQFLLEADDLYDEEFGESRLVAPPVLGESGPGYRDF